MKLFDKILGGMLTWISDLLPGYKTYIMMAIAGGMFYCQAKGHAVFTAEHWGMVGVGTAAAVKMGIDRVNKDHPVGTTTK